MTCQHPIGRELLLCHGHVWPIFTTILREARASANASLGSYISHFLATDIYPPFLILLFVIGDRFLLLLLLSRCPRFSAQSLFSLASFHLRSSNPSKWWVFPPFFLPRTWFSFLCLSSFFLSWFLVLDLLLICLLVRLWTIGLKSDRFQMDYDRVEISLFCVVRFTDRSILLWIHLDRKSRATIADLVGLIICELIAFFIFISV